MPRASTLSLDQRSLKVCADQHGRAWYVAGGLPPVDSGLGLAEFADSEACRRADVVRVPGHLVYAPLLLRLLHRQVLDGVRVQLCPPPRARQSAPASLLCMRDGESAPARGVWLSVGPSHRQVLMAAELVRQPRTLLDDATLDLHCAQLLGELPPYRLLALLKTAAPRHIAMLLALVLDPRLFVDPARPDRQDRLEEYLGLCDEHLLRVEIPQRLAADGRVPRRHRVGVVLSVWARAAKLPSLTAAEAHFLRHCQHLRDRQRRSIGDSLLDTSAHLLQVLRMAWLDTLSPGRREPLYEPGLLFPDAPEVQRLLSREALGLA